MSTPKKHHYVPAFYLKNWSEGATDEPPRVWGGFVSEDGNYTPWPTKVAVKNIGAKKNLYSHRHPLFPETVKRTTEEQFFQEHDNSTAPVLTQLIQEGPASLSADDRRCLATFLNGLIHRSRYKVEETDEELRSLMPSVFDDLRQLPSTDAKSKQNMEEVLATLADNVDSIASSMRLTVMARAINDPATIEGICKMRWFVVTSPGHLLVTSDCPVIVDYGLTTSETCLVGMALDPHRLLVLEHQDCGLDDGQREQLVGVHLQAMLLNRPRQLISREPLSKAVVQPKLDRLRRHEGS